MTPLQELRADWINCERCDLCHTRTNVVFGEGNPKADIMVIGEAPGREEDECGRPFEGAAGQILNQFLDHAFLDRHKDLYTTNVVCCRPTLDSIDDRTGETKTDNRPPSKTEREACHTRLMETIYLVDPLLIITIGKVPFQALLGKASKMAAVRGQMQTFHLAGRHTDIRYGVLPMYHTAFLLRTHDRRPEGPWGKTMSDWVKACNVIDYLREVYYGTPQPDREALAHARAANQR